MMKEIKISDVTMKQPVLTASLSFREKIELAKYLDRLGVSVIELEGIETLRPDSLRIKSIAAAVRESVVAVPTALNQESVAQTWNALSQAKKPRLQVPAALSYVQMEYLYHKKPDAMLTAIAETVSACRKLCPDVEFIADDATRSDADFLREAIETALQAGATTVTLCDAAGTILPREFAAFVADTVEQIPALAEVSLGVSCTDTLSMADSCSIAALCGAAAEVKAAACPADRASLANIARIVSARGDSFGVSCPVHVTSLSRIMAQIDRICQHGKDKNSTFDYGVRSEDSEIYLTAHDDREAVLHVVEGLGYELTEEDETRVYEAFQAIAGKKEQVSAKELDAIIASAAMQVPETYTLKFYAIQAANLMAATAHLQLKRGEETLEGVCIGDGPIDAAFLAIEQITDRHYELDDFQIQAVTEGREAMGQTVVTLLANGRRYSGRGISTDIVGASIKAYLSALNKIAYMEEEA